MDATERNKDEESKRFKSHNIEIDFGILVRIKESMVDLSSNCVERALKVNYVNPQSSMFIFTMCTSILAGSCSYSPCVNYVNL